MATRSITQVVYGDIQDMGGLHVRQPLPSAEIDYLSPFVLLHHGKLSFASDGRQKGIGAHPHRGFSPVTFLFTGAMAHRDSQGNEATVDAGGTQWMHAGSGVLHDETPIGRDIELIQLWVNSPARHKMDAPSYSPLMQRDTPAIVTPEGGRINVIAGMIDGTHGPIPTLSPITAATVEIPAGASLLLPAPRSHSAFLYLLDGALEFDPATTATGHHMVLFAHDGDTISFRALETTRALFMTGEPLDEPIVARGPFVMNSDDEIRQAYRDYMVGAMGVLE